MDCKSCHSGFDSGVHTPHILIKCGHSICESCLDEKYSDGKITCPNCQTVNTVSSIEGFPVNMALVDMRVTEVMKDISNAENLPTNRKENYDNSSTNGNTNKSISQHNADIGDHFEYCETSCNLHGKMLEAFCREEMTLLCIDCILSSAHRSHEMSSISDAAKSYRNSYFNTSTNVVTLQDKAESMKTRIHAIMKSLTQQSEEYMANMKNFFTDIRKVVDDRELSLRNEAEDTLQKQKTSLLEKESHVIEQLNRLQDLRKIHHVAERESDIETLEKVQLRGTLINRATQPLKTFSYDPPFKSFNKESEITTLKSRFYRQVVTRDMASGSSHHNSSVSTSGSTNSTSGTMAPRPNTSGRQNRSRVDISQKENSAPSGMTSSRTSKTRSSGINGVTSSRRNSERGDGSSAVTAVATTKSGLSSSKSNVVPSSKSSVMRLRSTGSQRDGSFSSVGNSRNHGASGSNSANSTHSSTVGGYAKLKAQKMANTSNKSLQNLQQTISAVEKNPILSEKLLKANLKKRSGSSDAPLIEKKREDKRYSKVSQKENNQSFHSVTAAQRKPLARRSSVQPTGASSSTTEIRTAKVVGGNDAGETSLKCHNFDEIRNRYKRQSIEKRESQGQKKSAWFSPKRNRGSNTLFGELDLSEILNESSDKFSFVNQIGDTNKTQVHGEESVIIGKNSSGGAMSFILPRTETSFSNSFITPLEIHPVGAEKSPERSHSTSALPTKKTLRIDTSQEGVASEDEVKKCLELDVVASVCELDLDNLQNSPDQKVGQKSSTKEADRTNNSNNNDPDDLLACSFEVGGEDQEKRTQLNESLLGTGSSDRVLSINLQRLEEISKPENFSMEVCESATSHGLNKSSEFRSNQLSCHHLGRPGVKTLNVSESLKANSKVYSVNIDLEAFLEAHREKREVAESKKDSFDLSLDNQETVRKSDSDRMSHSLLDTFSKEAKMITKFSPEGSMSLVPNATENFFSMTTPQKERNRPKQGIFLNTNTEQQHKSIQSARNATTSSLSTFFTPERDTTPSTTKATTFHSKPLTPNSSTRTNINKSPYSSTKPHQRKTASKSPKSTSKSPKIRENTPRLARFRLQSIPSSLNKQSPHSTSQFSETESNYLYSYKKSYIYTFGGFSDASKDTVEKYDVENDSWQVVPGGNMPLARAKCVALVVDVGGERSTVCVLGGLHGNERLKSCAIYLVEENTWEKAKFELPTALSGFCAVKFRDHLYVTGGTDGQSQKSHYRYSFQTKKWITLAPMKYAREDFAMAVGPDNFIYVMGGCGGLSRPCLRQAERYDIENDSWEEIPPMKCFRKGLSAITLPDGIYAIGGYDGEKYLESVEKFDPFDDAWSPIRSMNIPKGAATALSSPEFQYIYVIGGFNGNPLGYVERYDVLNDSWELVSPVRQKRFMHTSLILSRG
eukprot:CAMPEP_0115012512 /NCGR_PEP_ID=MMETSP0216-20121206/24783_1 /TAXON_ID=223996 /ORGANISM="Protocruzia adherens, Strain Boccale" /LENGTH=1414 /DNA_ID=CAMNT_0002381587 /DNA_START=141 /DNA_END=4385 /DNA_ORIENTATION=-